MGLLSLQYVGSSCARDWTMSPALAGRFFTMEALGTRDVQEYFSNINFKTILLIVFSEDFLFWTPIPLLTKWNAIPYVCGVRLCICIQIVINVYTNFIINFVSWFSIFMILTLNFSFFFFLKNLRKQRVSILKSRYSQIPITWLNCLYPYLSRLSAFPCLALLLDVYIYRFYL